MNEEHLESLCLLHSQSIRKYLYPELLVICSGYSEGSLGYRQGQKVNACILIMPMKRLVHDIF